MRRSSAADAADERQRGGLVSLRVLLRRLLGGDELPEGFPGQLDADERVLAMARTPDGAVLVVTSRGLWLPEGDGGPAVRRVGWHLVSRAVWKGGALSVVEAAEIEELDGAVLLADRPARRFRLAEPGRVPEVVHARVEGSILSRHHRDLPGGGAWFVQRRISGRDGAVLQVRPDPGTDPAVVATLALDVARALRA
jgi:hypothetical protein